MRRPPLLLLTLAALAATSGAVRAAEGEKKDKRLAQHGFTSLRPRLHRGAGRSLPADAQHRLGPLSGQDRPAQGHQ